MKWVRKATAVPVLFAHNPGPLCAHCSGEGTKLCVGGCGLSN